MWSSTRWCGAEARARGALIALTLTILAPAGAARAEPPGHVARYLPQAQASEPVRLTWFGLHVYDARLYTQTGFDPRSSTDQTFVLELTYARKLYGQAIAEASRDEIARLGYGSDAQRAQWFDRMRALFPDVDKGRRIAGVNVPGVGARFYVDGRYAGSIDDPAFARAFFAIWLDERTRLPRLREQLLRTAPVRTAAGA